MSYKQVAISGQDVQEMVTHHLACPPEGYLGSPYGSDLRSMLQTPDASSAGDDFIAKMREDLPVIDLVPDGQINVYYRDRGVDKRHILIDVQGQVFVAGGENL